MNLGREIHRRVELWCIAKWSKDFKLLLVFQLVHAVYDKSVIRAKFLICQLLHYLLVQISRKVSEVLILL